MFTRNIKTLVLSLCLAAGALAQSQPLPQTQSAALNVTSLPVGSARTAFNAAYVAHWAPPIQALLAAAPDQRIAIAQQLEQQGVPLDVGIMVLGGDPCWTMFYRLADGYAWVPASNQPNVQVAPGVPVPGGSTLVAYDPNDPPAGSFVVSLNPAAFPPYAQPAPTVVPAVNVVGAAYPGNPSLFMLGPGYAAWVQLGKGTGSEVTENGHTYSLVLGSGLMGVTYFQLVS